MKRRELIQSLSLISAHALFPVVLGGFVLSCKQSTPPTNDLLFFNEKDIVTIRQIIDVIIPATGALSASQVNTHLFLDEVFAKCMTREQQTLVREGLTGFTPTFQAASDRSALLTDLDQKAYQGNEDAAWFIPVKQYTLIGFFTSQEGTTKASNYVPIPGDYKGDIPCDTTTLNYGKTKLKFYL
jgi:hypothetical protein